MSESKLPPEKLSQIETVKARAVYGRKNYNELLEIDEETLAPGVHPRWVSTNDKQRIARHRMLGYEFARVEHGIKTKAGITDDAGDGTIKVGDAVLMICDKEKHYARMKENAELAESRITAQMEAEEFEAEASAARRPVYKKTSSRSSNSPIP